MSFRSVASSLVPPRFDHRLRRLERKLMRKPPEQEFVPSGWEAPISGGWNSEAVVKAYRAKLPRFRDAIAAPRPLGVPTEALLGTEPGPYGQNVMLEFVYALTLSSRLRGQLSVLDWGGGVGFLSLAATSVLPGVEFDYHVKEMPEIAAAGRELMPGVRFWDDEACLDRPFDLIVASASIQYSEDWDAVLRRFAVASRSYVLLLRVPVVLSHPSFVVRQRAYETQYVGWALNRDELLDVAASEGLVLEREFIEGYRPHVEGAPEQYEHRGYLFRTNVT